MKIGLVSFAHHHAEAYIAALNNIKQAQCIGITDEDEKRGKTFAELYKIPFFTSHQELFAQKPDGVIVCTETINHKAPVTMAAEMGIHVLCEKPLATTLKDTEAMIKVCEENNAILMTAFPMRFSPPIIEIKNMLDNGSLGDIYCLNTTNQGKMPRHQREWFIDKTLAGGGCFMDHIVHLADIFRWCLKSEVKKVYAQSNRIMHANEVDVETGGLVMLTFANNVFATIDCSWSKPGLFPTWGGLTMKLIGEKGVVMVDAFKQNIITYGNPQQHTSWSFWGSDSNQLMIQEFFDAISQERLPLITGRDGYKALEIVQAAYESNSTGNPVKL